MGKITNDRIEDYRNYLIDNERSAATISKYLGAVRDLFLFLGEKPPERRDILDYREHLLKTKTAKTVNAALSAINGFFLFAGREDLTVHYLKIQHKAFAEEKKELDMKEYRRLLKAAKDAGDERTWLLLQTLAGTGIRISEHVYITVEAAKCGRAEIRLKGKCRIILIPEELCRHLLSYARKKGIKNGAIFCTRTGKPLNRSNAWRDLKRLCQAAGVDSDKVFPHNFRHLFARQFYAQDRDIARLADVMGHSRIETTRLYVAVSAVEHEKELNRMGMIMPAWGKKERHRGRKSACVFG
ncbi:MAG: site-specific integrase [Clostridiales bacterium]|nr:site-specific integrase [Clostridiales bacterium]